MTLKKMGIYKITNTLTDKVYIGQSLDLKRRMSKHTQSLKNHNHPNEHLQSSFNKYGKDAFRYETLEEVTYSLALDEREIYWIDYCKSYNREFGYNIEHGGAGYRGPVCEESRLKMRMQKLGKKLPQETIEKLKRKTVPQQTREQISKTMRKNGVNIGDKNPRYGKPGTRKGCVNSEETRKKIKQSVAGKTVGKKNGFWGKKHTDETLKKISESRKGKGVGKKHTPDVIEKMRQSRIEYWANRKKLEGEANNAKNILISIDPTE